MDNANDKQDVLDRLDSILEKSDIANYSVSKLPQFVKSLVKDEGAFRAFLHNPYDALQQAGVNPDEVDIDMFTQFAIHAFNRHNTDGVEVLSAFDDDPIPHRIGETQTKQETEEGSNVNWENKTESYFWYEENVSTEGKRTSQKIKQKHSYRDKKLQEDGASISFSPENFLSPELRHLFFPSQPLITPELVEEIKRLIK